MYGDPPHPPSTQRDYSFHSHVLNIYTNTDYFWVDSKLLFHIYNSRYHDILISDHSPLTFVLNSNGLHSSWPLQRMDPQFINNPKFSKYLKGQ